MADKPTQLQMFYDVARKRGEANEFMMDLVREDDLTREQLEALIVKRPHVYGRYSGLLDKLPSLEDGAYFVQFHGGHSYAMPEHDEYERFETLKRATDAFRERINGEDRQYPVCDESASMLIWGYDPRGSGDSYPTYRLSVGPRGGVVKEAC